MLSLIAETAPNRTRQGLIQAYILGPWPLGQTASVVQFFPSRKLKDGPETLEKTVQSTKKDAETLVECFYLSDDVARLPFLSCDNMME